jgi:rhodanese-related sulfurtransferase
MKMKILRPLTMMGLMGIFLVTAACQSVEATPATATSAAAAIQVIGKTVIVDGGSYKDLSVAELQSLQTQKGFLLINVHTPFEGNLPQTDLSIAYDTIGQNLDKLPADKNTKIVLYCRSGRMSSIAAKELVKLGYTNIWSLDGGMAAWEQAGLKVIK